MKHQIDKDQFDRSKMNNRLLFKLVSTMIAIIIAKVNLILPLATPGTVAVQKVTAGTGIPADTLGITIPDETLKAAAGIIR